jgi:uncharacterized membrane protein YkvA (DUF1232 family)
VFQCHPATYHEPGGAPAAVAGLLYFAPALDAGPDFLPFLGFIDDAAVLGFILRAMEKDVHAFMEREEAR